mmetsp:Transcript_3730/g.5640  ORF Transcript_3730/g.5640 Transcript_3730/m.5640 type:complete len:138 (-) Transcript_3730:2765-3178(-)
MGVCSQHDTLLENLTVEQHIRLFFEMKNFASRMTRRRSIDAQIEDLISKVGLQKYRHFETAALSGGYKRRLSIALALVSPSDKSIVILDEPTTGLDATIRDQVWQLIKNLKQDNCIVMTTQHLQEAEELADRVALLD